MKKIKKLINAPSLCFRKRVLIKLNIPSTFVQAISYLGQNFPTSKNNKTERFLHENPSKPSLYNSPPENKRKSTAIAPETKQIKHTLHSINSFGSIDNGTSKQLPNVQQYTINLPKQI